MYRPEKSGRNDVIRVEDVIESKIVTQIAFECVPNRDKFRIKSAAMGESGVVSVHISGQGSCRRHPDKVVRGRSVVAAYDSGGADVPEM